MDLDKYTGSGSIDTTRSFVVGEYCGIWAVRILEYVTSQNYTYSYVTHQGENKDRPHIHIVFQGPHTLKGNRILSNLSKNFKRKYGDELPDKRQGSAKGDCSTYQNYMRHPDGVRNYLADWVVYTKHEEGAKLVTESQEIKDLWENVTEEQEEELEDYRDRKSTLNRRKRAREMKRLDIDNIELVCKKYKVQHQHQIFHLPREDQLDIMVVNNYEKLVQQSIDRILMERLNIERRWIDTEHSDGLNFVQQSIYNICHVTNNTKRNQNFLSHLRDNIEVLQIGVELLDFFLSKNGYKPGTLARVKFFQAVEDIMDAKIPKVNSLVFFGQADAGKSTLARLFARDLLNAQVGQIGNASPFMFQDCPNKRVILIEECTINNTNFEDFKRIMEGDEDFPCNIKGKPAMRLGARIPVITTSNDLPWATFIQHEPYYKRSKIFELNANILKSNIIEFCEKYKEYMCGSELPLNMIHYNILKHMELLNHQEVKFEQKDLLELVRGDILSLLEDPELYLDRVELGNLLNWTARVPLSPTDKELPVESLDMPLVSNTETEDVN